MCLSDAALRRRARDAADVIMRPALPFFLLLVSACCVIDTPTRDTAETITPTRDTAETIIARLEAAGINSDIKRWIFGAIAGIATGALMKKMTKWMPKFLGTAVLIVVVAICYTSQDDGDGSGSSKWLVEVFWGTVGNGDLVRLPETFQSRAPGLAGGSALGLLAGFNLVG